MLADADAEGYWSTEKGIAVRLEMLGHEVHWGYFNNAVKVFASEIGIKKFKMVGEITVTSCAYCEHYVGHVYRLGQFMPDLPAHVFCKHWWDLFIEAS